MSQMEEDKMLIALYFVIVNYIIPTIGAYLMAAMEPVMIIVIMLAGLVMVFGAVGIRISNNLGSTVVSGIFRAVGYIGRRIFDAIGWIVRAIARFIPRVYTGSRDAFQRTGITLILSNVLAFVVALVTLVIII